MLHLPASAGLSRLSPHSMSAVSALPTAPSHTPGPSLTLPRRGPGAPSHWLGIVHPLQPALYLKGTRLSTLWLQDEYLRSLQPRGIWQHPGSQKSMTLGPPTISWTGGSTPKMPQGIGQCLSSQRLSFYIWKEGPDFLNFILVRNRFQQDWHRIPVHESYIQYSLSGHGTPWAPLQVFIVLRTLARMPLFSLLHFSLWKVGFRDHELNSLPDTVSTLKTEHAKLRTFHL